MEDEKNKQQHDIAIALIQKDMSYVRESIKNIETTLAVFDRNFARKDELNRLEKAITDNEKTLGRTIDNSIKDLKNTIEADKKDIQRSLESKVDNKDFDPIKKVLQRINWIMIAGMVTALLSLIIQTSKA